MLLCAFATGLTPTQALRHCLHPGGGLSFILQHAQAYYRLLRARVSLRVMQTFRRAGGVRHHTPPGTTLSMQPLPLPSAYGLLPHALVQADESEFSVPACSLETHAFMASLMIAVCLFARRRLKQEEARRLGGRPREQTHLEQWAIGAYDMATKHVLLQALPPGRGARNRANFTLFIDTHIEPFSAVVTDGAGMYSSADMHARQMYHFSSNHSQKKYTITVRDHAHQAHTLHSNTIEAVWARLRAFISMYEVHRVSDATLGMYLHEFMYRFNTLATSPVPFMQLMRDVHATF